VDLRAAYANAVIAHPAGILGGVDFLHTGRVERVDTKSLHLFLNEGIIPLIPPGEPWHATVQAATQYDPTRRPGTIDAFLALIETT